MSAFAKWFEAQHGQRERTGADDMSLRDAVVTGKLAGSELRRREAWDARRESALYAWQVSEADKKDADAMKDWEAVSRDKRIRSQQSTEL